MNPAIARQLDHIDPADHAVFIEYCKAGDAWEAISDGAGGDLAAATRRMEKAYAAWYATESYRNRPPLRHPDTGVVIGNRDGWDCPQCGWVHDPKESCA